jgi:hypothetical protein
LYDCGMARKKERITVTVDAELIAAGHVELIPV